MPHAIIILADGFEEVEAITCIDLLRRAGIEVSVLGLTKPRITGAHGIIIETDGIFEEFNRDFDAIVLPGGMPGTKNLANSERVIDTIKNAFNQGLLCAAICAAPSVLGKAGILEGKNVTCYPGFQDQLGDVQFGEQPVIRDGTVITSRGVGTAILFALEVIHYLTNAEAASKIKKAILFD